MRIKTLSIVAVTVPALFASGLLFSILELQGLSGRLSDARANMLHSFKLADRLRQSSDDLTRMVRTYVVTGEPRYRDYFRRILAIRNGEAPRPPEYDGIYWDYMIPGEHEPSGEGEPRPLRAQLEEAGFTTGELALLGEAQARSDALVALEDRAMTLVGRAAVIAAVDPAAAAVLHEEARGLVHGLEYHRAKAAIMEPIDRFTRQVEGRIRGEIEALEGRERRRIEGAWLLLFATLVSLLLSSLWIRRGILKPIDDLTRQTRLIAAGDYRAFVELNGDNELGRLADDFNAMADAVRRDIDQRRARERELQQLRERAEAASRAKSQFLANMSHELRTPMNAVLGYAQLLEIDPQLNDTQREDVGQIFSAGQHLLNLINDILDLSKVEAGKLELERTEFDLRALVEEVARITAPQATGKGLELLIDVAPGMPNRYLGDPTRLRQILANLAGNAVKFTERGEVTLRAYPAGEGPGVVLEVQDSGIGISAEVLGKLFQPFTQADETTTRRFGGTGLGLALCRQLSEAIGGGIEVESEEGRGSLFRVRLPLPPVADGEERIELGGSRFLVVDDNAANRDILERCLEGWGAHHHAVDGGEAALMALRAVRYDWLLLDMQMPGMSGMELARRIASDPTVTAPRTLLLTSAGVPSEEELSRVGIELALSKPVGPSRLLDALASRLHARPSLVPPPAAPTARYRGRVLVVEDNLVNLQLAMGMLKRFGLESGSAADGVQALARLEQEEYDLVLMDVQMPVMDGYEAVRRLRERERALGLAATVVVALTANAMAGDRERALAAGMDDYLAKPVRLERLAEVLERWLPACVV